MELTLGAATLMLSIGLGLAGAQGMLSIVFFFMTRMDRSTRGATSHDFGQGHQFSNRSGLEGGTCAF